MSDSYVCSGAMMKCTMGTAPAKLTVLPTRTVNLCGQPQANISDHKTLVNLAPFGLCRSLAFPQTAAATAAALGTLTPTPCMHNTPMPWIGGKMDYLIKGQPALLKSCKCQCMWGGIITFNNNGQEKEGTQYVNKSGKESVDCLIYNKVNAAFINCKVVQKAMESRNGFDYNAECKSIAEAYALRVMDHGTEPAYDIDMGEEMCQLMKELISWEKRHPGFTPSDAKEKLRKLLQRFKDKLTFSPIVFQTIYDRGKLRGNLPSINKNEQAHHILPVEALRASKVLQDAVEYAATLEGDGFDFNGSINGIGLNNEFHNGSHPNYNMMIIKDLKAFRRKYPNYTPEEAHRYVKKLAAHYHKLLDDKNKNFDELPDDEKKRLN